MYLSQYFFWIEWRKTPVTLVAVPTVHRGVRLTSVSVAESDFDTQLSVLLQGGDNIPQ